MTVTTATVPAISTAAVRPCCVWLTGLPAAGKSTIGDALAELCGRYGISAVRLDGDDIRRGLSSDLDYSDAGRTENIRRAAEVASLLVRSGVVVIASFVSPRQTHRNVALSIVGSASFLEVFVDTPLAVCAARDPKGLYSAAKSGRLSGLTGVSDRYEEPPTPDLRLETVGLSVEAAADLIWKRMVGATE